jgi:septum formation protein
MNRGTMRLHLCVPAGMDPIPVAGLKPSRYFSPGPSHPMTLILASTSPIRQALLANAGIAFTAEAPGVDEDALKGETAGDVALRLAEEKALAVSRRHPGAWVIGSDSTVTVDGRCFDKPADRAAAADHLRVFSGRYMILTSAVALARDGRIEWSIADQANLAVRDFDESFIRAYLDAEWPDVAYCVGVFRMEGRGVQLFDRVDGSHFTILGLPLLPLIGALRERGLVAP